MILPGKWIIVSIIEINPLNKVWEDYNLTKNK